MSKLLQLYMHEVVLASSSAVFCGSFTLRYTSREEYRPRNKSEDSTDYTGHATFIVAGNLSHKTYHARCSYAQPDKTAPHLTPPLRINQVLLPILLRSLRIIPRILIPRRLALRPARPLVILIENLRRDAVEEFLGVDPQQTPGEVEGFVDGSGLVGGLRDEGAFELVEEFERELVF